MQKMRAKENTNLKNKINLKNLLVKNTQQSFNLQSINIQTITKDKIQNYFNEDKECNNIKFSKIRRLNNNIANNNLNNNYILNDDQISFFSFYNSNKEPSPINSLNSSPYSTHTQKKWNYKRLQKRYKNRYNHFNINTSNSLNNSSINSKIIYTNQSVSLNSSSNFSNNECLDSSDFSYRSRENKKKNYKELMMAEEDEVEFLKRKDVGLVSSEEEENNNSVDNNNDSEDNYNNEIERILIEIYNKNISIISSGNYCDIDKNKSELEDIEKQIKKYLKRKNLKTNFIVLKCLSKKIKELVGKYKEKVFEIDEIKSIYVTYKKKMNSLRNNLIFYNNNSVGSNVATNSNSSYDSYFNEDENLYKNSNSPLNEIVGKEISTILLRELINIKKTLKISSKEIENIFRYPLNLLKNENGKKIKFSVELMQTEEFCNTLLNDEFIYALLNQMKEIILRMPIPDISKLIEEVEKDCDHKNEMTRFIKFLNEKLGTTNENNDNNKNEINNYLDEYKIKENFNNNYILEEQIGKNIAFSVDTCSSTEGNTFKNDKIIKNTNSNSNENEDYYKNNNTNKNKKSKKKKQKTNNDENNKAENNEINFEDIDELLNYINDGSDSKKFKKKSKKCRKNKKRNNSNKEKENEDISYSDKHNCINNVENNDYVDNNDDAFEKIFNDFKRDIEKDSVYIYDINKIEPCLSNDFIKNKYNN